jgi:hypothetical protein
MKLKHRLFFEIYNVLQEFGKINDIDSIRELEFRILFKLTRLYYKEFCNNIDSKISFLKAISSPPLINYIKMRYYAHCKLLIELKKIFKTDFPKYDDLCLLKVILKQLSMLGSNALVRKDVIESAWDLYFEVRKQISEKANNICSKKKQIEIKLEKLDKSQKGSAITLLFQGQKRELETEIKKLQNEYNELQDKISECKNFNSVFQFFIKNATFDDEAQSMWLGELLRTGTEIQDYDQFSISKTHVNNSLFEEKFRKENKLNIPNELRQEYINFLVWLFYDNTTIIRKTLENFEKELSKDAELKNCFFENNQLKNLETLYLEVPDKVPDNDVKSKISVKNLFKSKIEKQYYYSSIKKYQDNPDGIDFIEKLICVLYAKLKLEKLNDEKILKPDMFHDNIKSLLEIFAKIMDADAAIFAMKGKINENIHDIHLINSIVFSGKQIIDIDEQYYTYKILKQEEKNYSTYPYPIIKNYKLYDRKEEFTEKSELGYEHMNILWINNPLKNGKNEDENNLVAVISFLYNKHIENESEYNIESQEHGRLLLLLKNELEKFIERVLKNKISNLWVEKTESDRKFEKIYRDNNHFMKEHVLTLSGSNIDLDLLEKDKFISVYESWHSFANMTITWLFSNLIVGGANNLYSDGTKLNDVFDDKYLSLLNKFKETRWKSGGNLILPQFDTVSDIKIKFHKQLLRVFVFQCIDNAMYSKHCMSSQKTTTLCIDDNKVKIRNDCPPDKEKEYIQEKEIFEKYKYQKIKSLNIDDYSCITLKSLESYCKDNNCFECDYKYEEKGNDFIVTIILKK